MGVKHVLDRHSLDPSRYNLKFFREKWLKQAGDIDKISPRPHPELYPKCIWGVRVQEDNH